MLRYIRNNLHTHTKRTETKNCKKKICFNLLLLLLPLLVSRNKIDTSVFADHKITMDERYLFFFRYYLTYEASFRLPIRSLSLSLCVFRCFTLSFPFSHVNHTGLLCSLCLTLIVYALSLPSPTNVKRSCNNMFSISVNSIV